jgi:von Willebrand factor type A domain
MFRLFVPFALLVATCAFAADEPVLFKSDVALTRVDAQVLDRDGRAITGLEANDFVLRVNGQPVPIHNFASEDMPIDILLLLDVSGSMQPHVQRIASAAQEALQVLSNQDRVAIMVFDNYSRVRLPFRNNHDEVARELNRLLRSESFNGGTRITRALLDATNYMQKEARPEARRAIVILTDDETQDREDEARVEAALTRAKTVLSFLQAPYEPPVMMGGGGRRRGTWGSGGGGGPGGGSRWPGGGGIGFPGGGPVILGPRGSGGYGTDPSHSAGTATIASESGGDTMDVDRASALEDTLARLRQRYALHFYLPDGAKSLDLQSVQVDLSQQARLRYRDAEVRSRRVFMSGGTGSDQAGPTVITRSKQPPDSPVESTTPVADETHSQSAPKRRRVAVNDDSGPRVNTVDPDGSSSGWPVETPPPQTSQHHGWPRADQNGKSN